MKDRAYRRAQDERVIEKRLRLVKRKDGKTPDVTGKTHYDHVLDKRGVLAKQHPMDCGNPKCYLCHAEKLLGKKKPSDRRKEQVIEDEFGAEE